MACFPLVGLVLGGCLVVGDYLLSQIWPPALAAGGVLGIWVLFTGALHLDGFVDCCDALLVAKAPEERLDILHDVHAGTFGIVGVVLLLLSKYTGVSAGCSYGDLLGVALFIAPVLSRWAMVYAAVVYPYGRPGGTLGGMFALQVKRRSLVISSVTAVAVDIKEPPQTQPDGLPQKKGIPGVQKAIAVGSGKGGVGKTTVAVNLAVALAERGLRVGLLDADVYGPNVPRMMGLAGQPEARNDKIVPLENYGVRVISLGFFVNADTPVIWRGPMVSKLIEQFVTDVDWGELDILLIDLPPGTGDAQLSLSQVLPLDGAIIVTTPQRVALEDAMKGLLMFQKVDVPIIGVIENMSYFVCPHCGERTNIFDSGQTAGECARLGVPFLGEIPLDPSIRRGGDEGLPVLMIAPDSPQAQAVRQVAERLAPQSVGSAAANPLLNRIISSKK